MFTAKVAVSELSEAAANCVILRVSMEYLGILGRKMRKRIPAVAAMAMIRRRRVQRRQQKRRQQQLRRDRGFFGGGE